MKHLSRTLCHQRGGLCLQKKGLLMSTLLKWKIALIMVSNRFPPHVSARTALICCSLSHCAAHRRSHASRPLTHFLLDQRGSSCRWKKLSAHWLNEELSELYNSTAGVRLKAALRGPYTGRQSNREPTWCLAATWSSECFILTTMPGSHQEISWCNFCFQSQIICRSLCEFI